MSLFSGDAQWPNINASHFGPVAMCVWDASLGVFRPVGSTEIDTTPLTINSPSSSSPSGQAAQGANGMPLTSNASRSTLFVQNLGINPLFVKFGNSGATDNNFNMVLAAGTVSGDGKGGQLLDHTITGAVSVSGIASNYIIWQN